MPEETEPQSAPLTDLQNMIVLLTRQAEHPLVKDRARWLPLTFVEKAPPTGEHYTKLGIESLKLIFYFDPQGNLVGAVNWQ